MSTEKQSSSSSTLIAIVVGVVLMVAGMYISLKVPIGFEDTLEHQGIPLDMGKTVAVIGVFLILFPVIRFFFITPLRDAIQERTVSLESTFAEAESLRTEMQKMRTEYEQRLVTTEANARDQIQAQIREAQNLRSSLMSEASARADEMVQRATQEIEAEKQKALTELRVHVVDLSLVAASKILGENMDNDKNRRLVGEFIDKVEVPA